jgi:DNA-3-methyladenine glycosylase II
VPASDVLTVDVRLQPPIDIATSVAHLGRWGDDGLDRWDGHALVRTLRLPSSREPIPYVATVIGTVGELRGLRAAISAEHAGAPAEIAAAIGATFVTARRGLADLAASDPAVERLTRLYPGVVPVLITDPFTALIRSISAQQVNLRWASTIRRRLAERYGLRHEVGGEYVYTLMPSMLADATVDELRELQLTNAKSRSVIACAQAAVRGELQSADLAAMDDEQLIERLTRLPGIGRWSAEWFLARTLGRPRVVAGDLGVRKAVGRMYEGVGPLPPEEQVRALTSHWGESATFVQTLALHDLAVASGVA